MLFNQQLYLWKTDITLSFQLQDAIITIVIAVFHKNNKWLVSEKSYFEHGHSSML